MHRLLSDGMLSRHGSSVAQTASPSMDIQVLALLALLAALATLTLTRCRNPNPKPQALSPKPNPSQVPYNVWRLLYVASGGDSAAVRGWQG